MNSEPKFDSIPKMKAQIARLKTAYHRTEAMANKAKSESQENKLIHRLWQIKASVEQLDSWISRETGVVYHTHYSLGSGYR